MADAEFPLPKYARVVTELRRRIEDGTYRPGDMLPSESQLVREFGIGRTTIVRALQMLQHDGWITREHGLGSYVKARPAGARSSSRVGLAVLDQPETGEGFSLVHAGPAPLPGHVAALLNLDDSSAVLRQWVRVRGGQPSELVSCWLSRRVASGTDLDKPERLASGVRQHLQTLKHVRADHVVERMTARLPDAREAELLQIKTSDAVLDVTATVYDAADVLLLVVAVVLPGDLHELEDAYTISG